MEKQSAGAPLAGTNELVISGTEEYQACDDKICYNPVSVPLSMPVDDSELTVVSICPPFASRMFINSRR